MTPTASADIDNFEAHGLCDSHSPDADGRVGERGLTREGLSHPVSSAISMITTEIHQEALVAGAWPGSSYAPSRNGSCSATPCTAGGAPGRRWSSMTRDGSTAT